MPRTKSMKSLEKKISKVSIELEKSKNRYNQLCRELLELQKEREDLEAKSIYAAFKKSRKSLRELMTFLSI